MLMKGNGTGKKELKRKGGDGNEFVQESVNVSVPRGRRGRAWVGFHTHLHLTHSFCSPPTPGPILRLAQGR